MTNTIVPASPATHNLESEMLPASLAVTPPGRVAGGRGTVLSSILGGGEVTGPSGGPPHPQPSRQRNRLLIGLAAVVFIASVLMLGLEGLLPFGLLLGFSIDSGSQEDGRWVPITPRNLGAGAAALIAFACLWLWYRDLPTPMLVAIAGALIALPLALEETDDVARENAVVVTRRNLVLCLMALVLFVYLFQDRGGWFNALSVVCVGLPLTLAMSRGWLARRGQLELGLLRQPFRRDLRAHRMQALSILVFCALIGALIAAGAADTARIEFSMSSLQLNLMIAIFAGGLVVLAALALIPRRRVQVATNLIVVLLSGFLAVELLRVSTPPVEAVSLDFPLIGDWYVYNSGRSNLLNGHSPNESNAVDFMRLDTDGRTHTGGAGTSLVDYEGFGAPVLAPIDGRVVGVNDGFIDNAPGMNGDRANSIVIGIGAGKYVVMAHVKQGSVAVEVGDTVKRGQAIAQVGNNGHSDEPHLHLQVQDSTAEMNADRTYPMVFRNVVITRGGAWPWGNSGEPRSGDIVERIGK